MAAVRILQGMKVRGMVLKCSLVGVACLLLGWRMEKLLTAALVATFLVNYDSYKKSVRREAGDGFERRPAELSEVVDLVHQDSLSMRYFNGVGNLTDVQICNGS